MSISRYCIASRLVGLGLGTLLLAGVPISSAKAQASEAPAAGFRIINLSPGAPPQDFCANRELFQANVPFGEARNYGILRAGIENELTRLFAGDGCDGPVLNTSLFTLPPGGFITAVAIRRFEEISAIILRDDNRPAAPGTARLRFVNAAVDSVALDLDLAAGGSLFTSVAEESSGGYVELPAGTVDLSLRVSGLPDVIVQASVELAEGGVHTLFASGILGGEPGVELIAVQDNRDLPPTTICGQLALEATQLRLGRFLDRASVRGLLDPRLDLTGPGSLQIGSRTVGFSDLTSLASGRLRLLIEPGLLFRLRQDGRFSADAFNDRVGALDPNGQITIRLRTAATDAACVVFLKDGQQAP